MQIAVIGAGSSGLIALKYLLDHYSPEQIRCFEQSHSLRGCWGDQRADFISTSSKYATQFSCYRRYPAEADASQQYHDFYRGAEFGDYLESFAEAFELRQCIEFGSTVLRICGQQDGWQLTVQQAQQSKVYHADALFICTGLVHSPKPLDSPLPISRDPFSIRGKRVVVMGGGESAVDIANHLAKPEHGNTVFMSLRSGIRVSPRYHPIRGVPSDFLRNRLLLSSSPALRNTIGEFFVTARIRYQALLSRLFPAVASQSAQPDSQQQCRAYWDLQLKARAKGKLFNVFHNKSDDFLDAVAQGRLHIVGAPQDAQWQYFAAFDKSNDKPNDKAKDEPSAQHQVMPELVVPAMGYQHALATLSEGEICLEDCYQGCVHIGQRNLFLIGFARPIIGNIPSISEMQARYAVGILSGRYRLPDNLAERHAADQCRLQARYPSIDKTQVYPVEHYPYCDVLAKAMGIYPDWHRLPLEVWLRLWLVPASTWHYDDAYFDADTLRHQKIYTPMVLNGLLALISLLELPWRRLHSYLTSPHGRQSA